MVISYELRRVHFNHDFIVKHTYVDESIVLVHGLELETRER